jgi:hypothetical protein
MSGRAETIGYSDPIEYTDYTYDEVLEAAAIYTLSPSAVKWVDVRMVTERRAAAAAAFDAQFTERLLVRAGRGKGGRR